MVRCCSVCAAQRRKSLAIRRPCPSHTTTEKMRNYYLWIEFVLSFQFFFSVVFASNFSKLSWVCFLFALLLSRTECKILFDTEIKKGDDIAVRWWTPSVAFDGYQVNRNGSSLQSDYADRTSDRRERRRKNKNQPNADKLDIIFDKCALTPLAAHFLFVQFETNFIIMIWSNGSNGQHTRLS